ncbi:MAG: Asp-tRNA(Asn)/Glu-tRNA(Gln) amidotransferase subunit GatC [Polyangiaceae bacterium]|nr:Asp-tRNA(Asn)/Glu-tRNA(Gln) amidotransferase subunit GatC [Polyangiaceae bacterium]
MSAKVDEALVARLASLANLELSAEETAELTHDLARIVDYVAILEEADVGDLPPLSSVRADRERRRPDEPVASLGADVALAGAPRAAEGGFVVPTFVDEG